MVTKIVDDISRSLENKCYLAALALALTLPDICGKAAYPTEGGTKKRYIDWYDAHIGHFFQEISKAREEGLADLPYLSGSLVYQLRCSFLHSGDVDVDKSGIREEQNKITKFNMELRRHDDIFAAGTTAYLSYEKDGTIEREYNVSVTYLCKILSGVALKYYKDNKDKFTFFSYSIIDSTQEYADNE